ncbi:hypothetical protein EON63_10750 [archaeon]|nr:MAG: hypothetical protein EON63_10750 [archaeon]
MMCNVWYVVCDVLCMVYCVSCMVYGACCSSLIISCTRTASHNLFDIYEHLILYLIYSFYSR